MKFPRPTIDALQGRWRHSVNALGTDGPMADPLGGVHGKPEVVPSGNTEKKRLEEKTPCYSWVNQLYDIL